MRIRSIKPEFWSSEDIAALDWETRFVFIALWSYVDDNGVGRDDPRLIVAAVFPLDDDHRESVARVSRALQTLSDAGLVTRYSVNGKQLLHVASWSRHQKIDRPNKPRFELPTSENAIPAAGPREGVARVSRVWSEDSSTGARRGEKGEDARESREPLATAPPPLPPLLDELNDEPPASRCPKHLGDAWTLDPCGACKDARLARQAWDRAQTERAEAEKAARLTAIKNCDLCDHNGIRVDLFDRAEKCNHKHLRSVGE